MTVCQRLTCVESRGFDNICKGSIAACLRIIKIRIIMEHLDLVASRNVTIAVQIALVIVCPVTAVGVPPLGTLRYHFGFLLECIGSGVDGVLEEQHLAQWLACLSTSHCRP